MPSLGLVLTSTPIWHDQPTLHLPSSATTFQEIPDSKEQPTKHSLADVLAEYTTVRKPIYTSSPPNDR
jgi:hypothetical protein